MKSSESDFGIMIFSESQALMSSSIENSWYANSGATKHMLDCCNWMTNYAPITFQSWLVTNADDPSIRWLVLDILEFIVMSMDHQI